MFLFSNNTSYALIREVKMSPELELLVYLNATTTQRSSVFLSGICPLLSR